ncbi:AAA family ATPase [Microvirga sp. BT689]|uniref:ATP-binding protein n=1 Tax=Microvirga arvi TaxID=2778731 RepID=UPI00194DDE2C|nr:AAA family ATPase [Microvirga arvi]MBM6581162.1 AAA family ATPase [Microvirga arvi]
MEEWLASIGLAERIPAFHEQRITADQLGDLTDEDLRELGLTIGERRRFQRALKAQQDQTASPLRPISASGSGENRPLTVMFADLVGSTGLSERLDPEDLLEVMRIYREFCGEAIARYGGHIARFLGDGILAYFCYPVANENDPERAVRAALDIVRRVGALRTAGGGELQVRIGLATGRVTISDLLAGGAVDPDTIIGSCPNLAARLQALAQPNEIIIAERTHERIAPHFTCEPLGVLEIRGFAQPHEVWRVIGERSARQVREVLDDRGAATPFVGREAELDLLQILWHKAQHGHGGSALVLGEAGIGKSRLVQHFVSSHASDALLVQIAASAFDANSSLRPFADYLAQAADIVAGDDDEAIWAKLEALLKPTPDARDRAQILAMLLGRPDAQSAAAALPPEQLREQTIDILVEHLVTLSGDKPICLVVEDLHWLDPTSSELLEVLLDELHERRLLLVLTARTEVPTEWNARVDTTLRLGRLDAEHVAEIMQGLFGGGFFKDLVRRVAERTDGVPLFVEEVARVLLHRQGEPDLTIAAGRLIPASLEESLMARLDRSGVAKDIALAASVIGRSARRDVLAAVCGVDGSRLDEALMTLIRLGILERAHHARSETYTFHHALLRDAAYASLMRERRRDLHERVAGALQAADPDGIAQYPEMLALHLSEAGHILEATPHWIAAARRSLAQSSLAEATQLLRRALTDLEKVPQDERTRHLRVEVSTLLGPALIGLKGPSAADTQELYNAAYELCEQLPDDPGHFPIYWGWWRVSPYSPGRPETLLQRAQRWNDPGLLLEAHHCSWAVQFQRAAFHDCRTHMQAGLTIYDSGNYTHHAPLYGNHDAKVCALGNLSQLCWMEGKLRQAREADNGARAWAESLNHLGSRVHAMGLTLLHSVYRRDLREVFDRSAGLMRFTSEYGMADHGAAGIIFQGWVTALQDDAVGGLATLEQGLAEQRAITTNEDLAVYLCLLAECLIQVGRADEAVLRITSELPSLERPELQIWMPELYRMLGEAIIAADAGAAKEVQHRFAQAASLAVHQQVPMLGLRVALSQARLARRLGDGDLVDTVREALARIPEPEASVDIAGVERFLAEASPGGR